MKTITINGAIRAYKYSWENTYGFMFTENSDPDCTAYTKSTIPVYIFVAPHTVEFQVADDFEEALHGDEVKALQINREIILAEHQKQLNEIEGRISSLLSV